MTEFKLSYSCTHGSLLTEERANRIRFNRLDDMRDHPMWHWRPRKTEFGWDWETLRPNVPVGFTMNPCSTIKGLVVTTLAYFGSPGSRSECVIYLEDAE